MASDAFRQRRKPSTMSRRTLGAVGWIAILAVSGCHSPEDGRPRGGGHGGDGGNYTKGGVHVPSKIDGTKTWTARPKT